VAIVAASQMAIVFSTTLVFDGLTSKDGDLAQQRRHVEANVTLRGLEVSLPHLGITRL